MKKNKKKMEIKLNLNEINQNEEEKIKTSRRTSIMRIYPKETIVSSIPHVGKALDRNYSKINTELFKIIEHSNQIQNSLSPHILNIHLLKNLNVKNIRALSKGLTIYYDDIVIVSEIFKISPEERTLDDLLYAREFLLKTKLYSYFHNAHILEEAIQKLITMCSLEMTYINYKKDDIIYKIGDIPKNFYLILSGKIEILKPTYKKELLSGIEYLSYLIDLKKNNEEYMFNLVIKENFKIYPILLKDFHLLPYIYLQYCLNLIIEEFEIDFIEILKICNITLESLGLDKNIEITKDYLNENLKTIYAHMPYISAKKYAKYIFLFDEIIKKEIQYYYYQMFDTLETGDFFGDFDLDRNTQRKTTVKVVEDASFAYFNYNLFGLHIFNEKQIIIDKEINYLHSNFFFSKIPYSNFSKKYFEHFIEVKFSKGSILFYEDSPLEYIYFIKTGEVNLYSKKNPAQIQKLLNDLKKNVKKNHKTFIEQKYKNIKSNPFDVDIEDELNTKNSNKIISLKDNEILGLESFYYGYNYLYSAVAINKTQVYKIEKMNLIHLLKNEGLCYIFLERKVENIMNIFYNRLLTINNTLFTLADEKELFNQKLELEKQSPNQKKEMKLIKIQKIFQRIKNNKIKNKKDKLPILPKYQRISLRGLSDREITNYKSSENLNLFPINSNNNYKHNFEDSLLNQIKKEIHLFNEHKKQMSRNHLLLSNLSEQNFNKKKMYTKLKNENIINTQLIENHQFHHLKNISRNFSDNFKIENLTKKSIQKNSSFLCDTEKKNQNLNNNKSDNNIYNCKKLTENDRKEYIDPYIPKNIKLNFIQQKYKTDLIKQKLKSYQDYKKKLSKYQIINIEQ